MYRMNTWTCSAALSVLVCEGVYNDVLGPDVSMSRPEEDTVPTRVWVERVTRSLGGSCTLETRVWYSLLGGTAKDDWEEQNVRFDSASDTPLMYIYPVFADYTMYIRRNMSQGAGGNRYETGITRKVRLLVRDTTHTLRSMVEKAFLPGEIMGIIAEYLCLVNPVERVASKGAATMDFL